MGIKKTLSNVWNAVNVFGSGTSGGSWWFGNVSLGTGKYVFKVDAQYHSAYNTNPLVYMVIDKQASVVSSLPIMFIDQTGKEVEGTLEQTIWANPNNTQTNKDFIYQLITDLLVHGRAYCYKVVFDGSGLVQAFHILPVSKTTKQRNANKEVIRYDTYINDQSIKITGEDCQNVLEIRMPSVDGSWLAKSKLSVLGEVVSSSTANLETEAYTYQNGGGVKILTSRSDLPMTPDQKKDAQDDFDKNHTGVAKAGSVRITNADLDAIDLTRSPSDLNLDPSLMSKLRLIAGVYGLDSKIFGDPSASTYNNMREAITAAFLQVFIPLCRDYVVKEFNSFWLEESGSLLRMEINEDEINEIKTANKEFADTELVRIQTVDAVLKMPITREGKVSILVNDLDYSQEQAEEIMGVSSTNKQLEKLKSMPVLVATKILERLTDEEIKMLLQ